MAVPARRVAGGILGILCFFYLVDGPAQARWLSAAEKALLLARLDRERAAAEHAAGGRSVLRQLGHRTVVLMSIAYFGLISVAQHQRHLDAA